MMHQFVALMKKIECSGTFSTFGKLKPVFPGLVIKNVGEIALPLTEDQAEKIIRQCEQAPFGRGEETIIDTDVRNVWQISPEALEFTNPQWDLEIANACKEVAAHLGLSDCKINFDLYKVLVYAKGSFFKEHRDTEKIPNMFATMVINLPSTHAGGELIVRHGGEKNQYSFAGKSKFYPEFAAFYADCYHEVKPIQSGYRLSLIYNLAIADRNEQPLLSKQKELFDQVEAYVQKWSHSNNDNSLLVYLLDHSYSEQNIAIANLKNNDFAKTSILLKTAEKNNCKAFLCLVSYIEESYGEYNERNYRSRSSDGEYEEYGINRQEIYAHHFINVQGEKINVEKLNLDEDELLAEIPLREGPGREVSISEATGNEGATRELWYHRGAIIMWPEHRDLDIVLKMDIAYAIHRFKKLIQNQDVSREEIRKNAIFLARHIIDNKNYRDLTEITESLIVLGDIELLKKQIRNELKYDLSHIDSKTMVRILDQFSWRAFEKEIDAILCDHASRFKAAQPLAWLHRLLLEKPSSKESDAMIAKWFQGILKWAVSIFDIKEAKNGLSYIFQILSLLGQKRLTDEVLSSIQNYQKPLSLPFIYAPALLNAIESCKQGPYHLDSLKEITEDFLKHAQAAYPAPPKPPENGARKGRVGCTCDFCKAINEFLPDQQRTSMSFEQTLQRNLIHIEEAIAKHHLDLEIHIDRQPPKFKGTVNKNQNSYEQALKRFVVIEEARNSIEKKQ